MEPLECVTRRIRVEALSRGHQIENPSRLKLILYGIFSNFIQDKFDHPSNSMNRLINSKLRRLALQEVYVGAMSSFQSNWMVPLG